MCMLCVEIQKGRMTFQEINRALSETPINDLDHVLAFVEACKEAGMSLEKVLYDLGITIVDGKVYFI